MAEAEAEAAEALAAEAAGAALAAAVVVAAPVVAAPAGAEEALALVAAEAAAQVVAVAAAEARECVVAVAAAQVCTAAVAGEQEFQPQLPGWWRWADRRSALPRGRLVWFRRTAVLARSVVPIRRGPVLAPVADRLCVGLRLRTDYDLS